MAGHGEVSQKKQIKLENLVTALYLQAWCIKQRCLTSSPGRHAGLPGQQGQSCKIYHSPHAKATSKLWGIKVLIEQAVSQ